MKIGDGMYKPTRRDFLKLLGVGAAWALLGCAQPQKPVATPKPTPTPTPTPPKDLKIGIISFRAGPAAAFGVPAHNTLDYLAEQVNAAGGIAGAKVKVIHEDQGLSPSDTVEKAKKLCLQDKVDVVTGIPGTNHSLAVAPVCDENNTFFLQCQARAEYGTWKDPEDPSKGVFDWVFHTANSTTSHAVQAAYMVKELFPETKVIAQIHQDYAYGYDNYNYFTAAIKKLMPEAELLDPLYPKIFSPDYTPYVSELVDAKPDFIFTSLWGTDFTRFVDQLIPYKLLKGTGGNTILEGYWDFYPAIGRDIPVYGHPQPFNQGSIEYEEYRNILTWYKKKYGNLEMGAVADIISAFYTFKAAVEKAYDEKGAFPTRDEIRDAMENLGKVPTPYGEGIMRKEDHRVLWTVECGVLVEDTKGYGLPYLYKPKIKLEPSKHEPPAFMKGTDWIAKW
jgi:branched-chain amino acid transport system substrate-binding protein